MATQRTFPKISANFGFICCDRNGIRFPMLYRIDVTATSKGLKDIGIEYDPNVKPGSFVFLKQAFQVGMPEKNNYAGVKYTIWRLE